MMRTFSNAAFGLSAVASAFGALAGAVTLETDKSAKFGTYITDAKDKGEATGQDVKGFGGEWYLLTAEGEKVGHASAGAGKR